MNTLQRTIEGYEVCVFFLSVALLGLTVPPNLGFAGG
jgi:hypothetical protein